MKPTQSQTDKLQDPKTRLRLLSRRGSLIEKIARSEAKYEKLCARPELADRNHIVITSDGLMVYPVKGRTIVLTKKQLAAANSLMSAFE